MDLHHEPFANGGWDVIFGDAQIGAHIGTLYVAENQQFPFNRVDCNKKNIRAPPRKGGDPIKLQRHCIMSYWKEFKAIFYIC